MPKEKDNKALDSNPEMLPVRIETKVMDGGRIRPRAGAFVKVIGQDGKVKEEKRIAG
ncbi:hypothetical protein KKG63_03585 [Patescibacteria group bacterium]|nr:hypothetical protein [Patescibacteria group bacterium]MBU1999477.1 hypothetical protein [Candidatus Omnitrophota bacterium]